MHSHVRTRRAAGRSATSCIRPPDPVLNLILIPILISGPNPHPDMHATAPRRPLGYCIRVREAVMDLARGLLRLLEEEALALQRPLPPERNPVPQQPSSVQHQGSDVP